MSESSPPPEAQRFGRSQTPESPRPVHIPEPSNIPVLQNQMDPVFNDTSTYNIRPGSQPQSADLQSPTIEGSHHAAASAHAVGMGQAPAVADNSQFDTGIDRLFSNDPTMSGPTFLQSAAQSNGARTQPPSFQTSFSAGVDASHAHSEPSGAQVSAVSAVPIPSYMPANQQGVPDQNGRSSMNLSDPPSSATNVHLPTAHVYAPEAQPSNPPGGTIDYQSLLEQVSKSASTAPPAATIAATTTDAPNQEPSLSERTLPSVPGLPPKPPPQENSFTLPDNTASSLGYYAQVPQIPSLPSVQGQNTDVAAVNAHVSSNASVEPPNFTGANGLPPPPSAATSQPAFPQALRPPEAAPGELPRAGSTTDRPWTPNTQSIYDQFLQDERNYVTEGVWDRFPVGSRLFVGNLPTEKVTKRDLFHVFHKYGRLAQISIKQAYGFVQFHDAEACRNALVAEQSVEIRGRKVHLEISKPQKNTRNAGGGNKARRRSRSPDRGVPRDRVPYSDFRDEPGRKRDDYRPNRSPSPRAYRSRDGYRARERSPRSYDSYDSRTRSPGYGSSYRPPSPRSFDDDSTLPLPHRAPQDVPDVQLLVLEEIASQFVNYVEQGFRQKGLKAQTIWLSPRLPLAAVVKRQIREGVQAIVKLTRNNQYNSKIPLQLFERTPGTSNVNFNEYVELDIPVAADIVIHQRQKERGLQQTPVAQSFPSNQPFQGQAPFNYAQQPQLPSQYGQTTPQLYPQPQMPQAASASQHQGSQYRPPSQSSATPNSGGPNLQELLANLRQPSASQQPQQQPVPPAGNRPTDLAGLLSNVAARQHNQSQPYGQTAGPNQYPTYQNQPTPQGYGQGYQQTPPNLQNIVEQLSRQSR